MVAARSIPQNRLHSSADPFDAVLRPPPDETLAQREARILAEQQAKRVSDAIDEQLRTERAELKKNQPDVKILLLGQSESGKSTTLKRRSHIIVCGLCVLRNGRMYMLGARAQTAHIITYPYLFVLLPIFSRSFISQSSSSCTHPQPSKPSEQHGGSLSTSILSVLFGGRSLRVSSPSSTHALAEFSIQSLRSGKKGTSPPTPRPLLATVRPLPQSRPTQKSTVSSLRSMQNTRQL
jgi:hypothetical protein